MGAEEPRKGDVMNDIERMKWLMAVGVVNLTRPVPGASQEEWTVWLDCRDRLLDILPSQAAFSLEPKK